MFCKQCGAKVPDGTLFCVGCGNPMNAKPVSGSARALQGGPEVKTAPPVVQPPVQQPPKPTPAYQPPQGAPTYQPPKPAPAYQPPQVAPAYQPPKPTPAYPPAKAAPITVADPTAPAPVVAKSGGGKGILIAVIVVLVVALVGLAVFGAYQGWFGSSGAEDDPDRDSQKESTQSSGPDGTGDGTSAPDSDEPPIGEPGVVKHQWEGLTFYLSEDLEQYHWDVDYINYYGDELQVLVASYVLSDYADDLYTSRDFATHCADALSDSYEDMTLDHVGDVYYYEGYYPAYDRYEVNGFYVSGDYGYIFMVYSDPNAGLEQEMIRLATSAVVDDSVIPAVQPGGSETEATMRPSYDGLTLELDVMLETNGYYVGGVGYCNDDLNMEIYSSAVNDIGASVKDAASLAELYRRDLASSWDEVGVGTRRGTKYVLCQDEDGFTCVIGCYVEDDWCWEVWVYSYTDMVSEDDLVRMATSGRIGS